MSYHIFCLDYGKERALDIRTTIDKIALQDNVTYFPVLDVEEMKALHNVEVIGFDDKDWFRLATFYNSICAMKKFLQTTHDYIIICENDLKFHKDIAEQIKECITNIQKFKLDGVVLSYFIPNISVLDCQYAPKCFINNSLLGAQMFMLTRSKCQEFIDKYDLQYILSSIETGEPLISDWVFTKHGKMAFQYPMAAVQIIHDEVPYLNYYDYNYVSQNTINNLTDEYL